MTTQMGSASDCIDTWSARCARVMWLALCGLITAGCASAPASPDTVLSMDDVDRFAAVMHASHPAPDAAALQRGYLDPGSPALHAFDRDAIGGASRLADAVAAQPQRWRMALARCGSEAARREAALDAQAIAAAYAHVFPDFVVPPIHVLAGADSSSGMRLPGPTIAVAVERVCATPDWRPGFRALLAHEFAHVPQPEWPDDAPLRRDLLAWALREGAANYLGALVRGEDPSGADDAWAMAREADLMAAFHHDRAVMRAHWQGDAPDAEAVAAGTRWFWNAATPDRPQDLGYWIGQRIWHGYVTRAPDRDLALRAMLRLDDLDGVLQSSGYAPVGD
ncbi:hypothetical protein V3391_15765 [Luteimonas sp. SMYT11W]|uniref:DUF2268 domain-containing protein n=1 Tax=Luteimonas flava TaxID=3115822 RepID=A0ABU7WI68_9GAMM